LNSFMLSSLSSTISTVLGLRLSIGALSGRLAKETITGRH
jgi:hypothetical protein